MSESLLSKLDYIREHNQDVFKELVNAIDICYTYNDKKIKIIVEKK